MKTYIALLALILSFTSYSQTSTFKHDIGLKMSSFQPERFQIQYRYHANEKWAFSANAYFGNRSLYYSNGDYIIQDSIYQLYSTEIRYHTYGIDFGAIRKLNFMKHNFYYVGGSVGVGAKTRSQHESRTVYEPHPVDPTYPFGIHPLIGTVLESEYTATIRNSMNVNGRIFVGADVPILDRLYFNFELGILGALEVNAQDQFTIIEIPGYLSGGLRYRFGKTDI